MAEKRIGTVFISHSAKEPDRSVTQTLAQALVGVGLDVWWDKEGLEGGQFFPVEILEAIIRQRFFLFVVSSRSVASKWCQRELIRATELEKEIIPLVLEHIPAEKSPLEFAGLHYVEITAGIENSIPSILKSLGIGPASRSHIPDDPFARDGRLIQAIADQLPYAKTFTDSLNMILLLERIGLSCAETERARNIFSDMRANNNRSASNGVLKIDYDKVRTYLLRKWSE